MAVKRTPYGEVMTDHSVPARARAQRLDALERANLIRMQRATLKRDLKAGRVSIHTLLQQPPEYIATAKVIDMLLAVPLYGRVKVNKILAHCRISPSKTIGGLSERQRDELVRIFGERFEAPPLPRARSSAARRSVAPVRPDPDELRDEELARGLARLVEEARQVGRLAGRAACEAGEQGQASAPRPDIVGLQAALQRTLRPTGELAAQTERIAQPQTPCTATLADASCGFPQDEHLDALRRSSEVRFARAVLKRKIGDHSVTVREVILTCPWEAASMTIAELLTSQRRWGATRCSTFLARIGMPETKTLGSMTERQRSLLVAML